MPNRALLVAVAAALLTACAAQGPATAGGLAAAPMAATHTEAQRPNELVEAYFEDQLKLRLMLATSIGDKRYNDQYPVSISPEFRAREQQLERDYLARVQQIDASKLTGQDLLSYHANSAASDARSVAETERYIAIPGQALAYKIGQLKISELRARAEKELGPRFDVRKFHTAILADGALPLDVLEAKVDRWIASQKGG